MNQTPFSPAQTPPAPPAGAPPSSPAGRWRWRKRIAIILALSTVLVYLLATPPNPLDKADWTAYAVCHRIPSHSLEINGRPLPLCARCTGTFLGATLAILYYLRTRPRADTLPPWPILLLLLLFSALWAADGINSFIDLQAQAGLAIEPLYPPQNWLRLLTGTLNGLMMGTILYPIAMGTFWKNPRPLPVLANFYELARLLLLALLLAILVLSGWTPVVYLLALLSSAGVLLMLSFVNSVMLVILLRRDAQAQRWRDLLLPLLGGLALAVVMVSLIAVTRYGLTGTLTGMPGLPP